MNQYVTATEARKQFFTLIEQAGNPGFPVTITHEGVPRVTVMSTEEFEGWQETMDILSDATLVQDIRKGLQDIRDGNVASLEQIKKRLHS